jgi:Transglutaminase-like superfamily
MDIQMSVNPIKMKLNFIDSFKGLLSVVIAFVTLRFLSLEKISKILNYLKPYTSREICAEEAEIVWNAVRKSSFFFSGRVACIELSLAFVIFALSKGLSTTWCVGVASEPFRAHSWVEVDGKPFHEESYIEDKDNFRKLFTV